MVMVAAGMVQTRRDTRSYLHLHYRDVNAARRSRNGVVATRATESAASTASTSSLESLVASAAEAEDVYAASDALRAAMKDLRDKGALSLWGAEAGNVMRRNVFNNEITRLGVKADVAKLAVPSVRDDASFLALWVLGSSIIATIGGVVLPGDWGFFVPYLVGGTSIAVLAVGSVNPSLLQGGIEAVAMIASPDTRDRVVRHEAAHFLTAYLLGVPITGYSIGVGEAHTDLCEAGLGRSIFKEGGIDIADLERLSVIAMAGVAGEALHYEEVKGQTADLTDLQRMINRAAKPLRANEQMELTRWALFAAAKMIASYRAQYEALVEAMKEKKDVVGCFDAIESIPTTT